MTETLGTREARRLALVRAGLLKPELVGLPRRAGGGGLRARRAAHAVIGHFGYLQLDTVSIAGARSHAIVLLSRLEGLDSELPERLLAPEEPLFEYWGHEASWLPIALYPLFEFRRRAFRSHPWWGDLVGAHPQQAEQLLARFREEGPLRSADLPGSRRGGWWNLPLAKKLCTALWSSGELAIARRDSFQRTYDLAERVIPAALRAEQVAEDEAIERLLLLALAGHGWATTGTLRATWRLRNRGDQVRAALARLVERGEVLACALEGRAGWIRPADLELAAGCGRWRPRADRGVLLSPFDPLLWDRDRVRRLFDFDQVLEIYKPGPQRVYGYYCLPVLAGERLIARYDLKADRRAGRLHVLSLRYEGTETRRPPGEAAGEAARAALQRFARALSLRPV